MPPARQVTPRTPAEVLALAAALKRENPARTAAQVARILRTSAGWSPAERTLQRHFVRRELLTRPDGSPPPVFGRFEAARPNEMWTGDALHGPVIGGRKTYLFAFIDDHSRLITGHRFGHAEDTVRLAAALRPALASRGVPDRIYVHNGSAFVDAWLLRACAVLGVKLTHSTPGRPEGRGEDRAPVPHRPRAVPGGDYRRSRPGRAPAHSQHRRAEPAVHRMGGNRLPPPRALRDRPGPAPAMGGGMGRESAAAARPRSVRTRRSCGANTAPSARPPQCPCTATPIKSIPR